MRHGQTEWNAAGRIHGQGDAPLTDLGRRQARDHADRLALLRPHRIISSPLGRARATARILSERLGLPVEHDEALRERDVGIFEGWSWREVAARRPEEHARRLADPWRWRPPDGESFEDVARRLQPLLERLRSGAAARIVLVSHGALARPLLGELLELDEAARLDLRAPNDVFYRVRLGPPPEVSRIDASGERPGLLTGALQEALHYDPASRPER